MGSSLLRLYFLHLGQMSSLPSDVWERPRPSCTKSCPPEFGQTRKKSLAWLPTEPRLPGWLVDNISQNYLHISCWLIAYKCDTFTLQYIERFFDILKDFLWTERFFKIKIKHILIWFSVCNTKFTFLLNRYLYYRLY